MEILSTDAMRAVLDQMEKIEIRAIQMLSLFRDPHNMNEIFCDYSNMLLDIQIKIRDFRVILSKNTGGWNRRIYENFLNYSSSTFNQCDQAASQKYSPVYRQEQPQYF